MEFTTPHGLRYEVEETHNLFSEVADERPRLSPDLVASLVVRLEGEIQLREGELQTAYYRVKTMGDRHELDQRRITVLEVALDEMNERNEAVEAERFRLQESLRNRKEGA